MPCGWQDSSCLPLISSRFTRSLKRAGTMPRTDRPPFACPDANIFLAVLIPEATKAPKEEIRGATRVLKALEEGHLHGVSTTILLGEMRYVYLRENRVGFEIPRAAIEAERHLRLLVITVPLAVHAAELRQRYYSKRNTFS